VRIALDTNAYSALLRGDDATAKLVRSAERVHVCSVVLGELLYGFRCGARFTRNWELLEQFLANPYVQLDAVTLATADRYGRIASALRTQGTPLPQNDIWIAAHAMETGLILISFDAHFERVAGLACVIPPSTESS
jgi:tRNA(fMet)-specific endonuclease VapC